MREIEFRGWDTTHKRLFAVDQLTISKGTWSIEPGRGVSIPYQPHITLMQYTGFTDCNGKKIFEGDILTDRIKIISVVWSDEAGCWDSVNEDGSPISLLSDDLQKGDWEIGGHIHA